MTMGRSPEAARRSGETRTCLGCHEDPNTAPPALQPAAVAHEPVPCLPHGDEFTYRAKVWLKGELPPQADERARKARAVTLNAR